MYRLNTKEKRVQARESNLSFTKRLAIDGTYKEEVYKDLLFVTYEKEVQSRGQHVVKPMLQIYKGTQSNPYSNYYYHSVENRDEAIAEAKKHADSRIKYTESVKAEKKSYTRSLKVGDILSASWGYDQTNVDWYQVVDTFGKKGVVIRRISSGIIESTGMDQGIAKGNPNDFIGDPMRKMEAQGGSVKICSVSRAYKNEKGTAWSSWYY